MKRAFVWILLAGFVLLLVNILFIGWHREASAYVYLIIAASFLIVKYFGRSNEETVVEDDCSNGSNDE